MPELEWVRTYEHGGDYIESVGGVAWHDAPTPLRLHQCFPQTRGWMGLGYVERCACGAIRDRARGPWAERNQTRKGRARKRREERAPKETVTCRECGQGYEAVAGSSIAAVRLCNSCWGHTLIKGAGL